MAESLLSSIYFRLGLLLVLQVEMQLLVYHVIYVEHEKRRDIFVSCTWAPSYKTLSLFVSKNGCKMLSDLKLPGAPIQKTGKGIRSTRGIVFCLSFVELNHDVCFRELCPLVIVLLSVLPKVVCTVLTFFKANKTKAVECT